jgi:hypothetical protein
VTSSRSSVASYSHLALHPMPLHGAQHEDLIEHDGGTHDLNISHMKTSASMLYVVNTFLQQDMFHGRITSKDCYCKAV